MTTPHDIWLRPGGDPPPPANCPVCKGRGRLPDGAGRMDDCDACDGRGTHRAYELRQAYVRGWNAAMQSMQRWASRRTR